MPTINDYKKKALNDAGYSGDINTAEYKWLRAVCDPYVGTIPDMWRYALREAGFTNANDMLIDLGHTGAIPNKWYKYWSTTPLGGIGIVLTAPVLDLQAASDTGSSDTDDITADTTPDFNATFSGGMIAGDTLRIFDGDTELSEQVITPEEVAVGIVVLGLSALDEGEHIIKARIERGSVVSPFGQITITITNSPP